MLAGTKLSQFWILLELRVMEVVVVTTVLELIRRAKLQSKYHHQQTNTQLLIGQMAFLSPNQQCQSTEGKCFNIVDLASKKHIPVNVLLQRLCNEGLHVHGVVGICDSYHGNVGLLTTESCVCVCGVQCIVYLIYRLSCLVCFIDNSSQGRKWVDVVTQLYNQMTKTRV